jgi:hypothetical protein
MSLAADWIQIVEEAVSASALEAHAGPRHPTRGRVVRLARVADRSLIWLGISNQQKTESMAARRVTAAGDTRPSKSAWWSGGRSVRRRHETVDGGSRKRFETGPAGDQVREDRCPHTGIPVAVDMRGNLRDGSCFALRGEKRRDLIRHHDQLLGLHRRYASILADTI